MNKVLCIFSKISIGLFSFYSFSVGADLFPYINALASLNYHVDQLAKTLDSNNEKPYLEDEISFSEDEVDLLWAKVRQGTLEENESSTSIFERALSSYENLQDIPQTQALLEQLWVDAINLERQSQDDAVLSREKVDHKEENHSHIPESVMAKMKPYLISENHPMYATLNEIFTACRVTENQNSFEKAGFKILDIRPRSHIYVARHSKLPGYLVKANLDNDLHVKQHTQSWEWFVLRCIGAEKIKSIIHQFNIVHFKVAKKWIYPLPSTPLPPNDDQHTQHLAILLVTDMKLTSVKQNLHAWSNVITEEHLDELYTILSRAKGSSYRPDNIAYTREGTFAFIDTEYPTRGPDYGSIRNHLNSKMLRYWDKIVRQGGPSL